MGTNPWLSFFCERRFCARFDLTTMPVVRLAVIATRCRSGSVLQVNEDDSLRGELYLAR